MPNIEKKIFIHHNFNKNQIKQVLLENNDYDNIPSPTIGEDKGLIYYDTILDRVLVWNGNFWKIVKYLDDRDYVDFSDVLVENIWSESNLIPATYSIAQTSSFVQQATASTTYIPNSYSFSFNIPLDQKARVVPSTYGSFYTPIVTASDSTVIPSGNWKIQDNMITFFGGFLTTPLVDPTHPPSVNYWTYSGRLGTFKFIGGVTNTMEINTSIPIITLPTVVRNDNIISVNINGLLIYGYTFNANTHQLTIDESALGFNLDISDIVRIELNS
jgi:hypothetical protein